MISTKRTTNHKIGVSTTTGKKNNKEEPKGIGKFFHHKKDLNRASLGTTGRLEKAFEDAKKRGEAALITYITGGYPTAQDTPAILMAMQEAGAAIVELGVPFHDPFADGLTLQRCNEVAIKGGTTGVRDCLKMVTEARLKGLTIPVILMGYYNGFKHHPGGIVNMCHEAKHNDVDGVLAVGLPEGNEEINFHTACLQNDLSCIPIVMPDSSDERVEKLASLSSSFLYVVSVKGKTGARDSLPKGLNETVARVRDKTGLPLCVGFGISKPEMVHGVANVCDGAIVGSSITNHLNDSGASTAIERANIIREYVANLKTGAKQSVNPEPKNQALCYGQVPMCSSLNKEERESDNDTMDEFFIGGNKVINNVISKSKNNNNNNNLALLKTTTTITTMICSLPNQNQAVAKPA